MIDRVNDAHIHVGVSPEINQSLRNWEEFDKFRRDNSIERALIFGFDSTNEAHLRYKIGALKWIDELNYGFKGFLGGKFHGSYLKKPCTHEDFRSHIQSLDNKILLVHCGMYKDGDVESNTSFFHPLMIAQRYPNIQVIMGHMGGSVTNVVKRCVDFLSKDGIPRNLWLETSGITTPYAIEYAVDKLGDRQILFGSDAPWCSFNAMKSNVVDADIEDISKDLILYHNFNTLMRRIK